MSFNILILFFILSGCGVKSLPTAPLDSAYPSYQSKFTPQEKPAVKPTQAPIDQ